jgi:hypothetical protein
MPTTHYFRNTAIANRKKLRVGPAGNGSGPSTPFKIGLGSKLLQFDSWVPADIVSSWLNAAQNDKTLADVTPTVDGNGVLFTHNRLGEDFHIRILSLDGEEYVDTPMVSEEQRITFNNAPTGGTFTLTFMGHTTDPITYVPGNTTATAANITTALEALPNIQVGDVAVTWVSGTTYKLDFSPGQYAGLNVDLITVNYSGLTGGNATATATVTQQGNAGTNEVQKLEYAAELLGTHEKSRNEKKTFRLTGHPNAGTFTLSLPGFGTSDPIPYNANRVQIRQILENLVGLGNIKVTGGPLPSNDVTLEFIGSLAGTNIGDMTADPAGLDNEGEDIDVTVTQTTAPTTDTDLVVKYTKPSGISVGNLSNYYLVFRITDNNGTLSDTNGPWTKVNACDGNGNAAAITALLTDEWDWNYMFVGNHPVPADQTYRDTRNATYAYAPGIIFESADITVTGDLTDGDNAFTVQFKRRCDGLYGLGSGGPGVRAYLIEKVNNQNVIECPPSIITHFVKGTAEVQEAVINEPFPISGNFYLKIGTTTTGPIAAGTNLSDVAMRMGYALADAFGELHDEPTHGHIRVHVRPNGGTTNGGVVCQYPVTAAALQAAYGNANLSSIWSPPLGSQFWQVYVSWVGQGDKTAGASALGFAKAENSMLFYSAPTTYAEFAENVNQVLRYYLSAPAAETYAAGLGYSQFKRNFKSGTDAPPIQAVFVPGTPDKFQFTFADWPYRGDVDAPLIEFLSTPGTPPGVEIDEVQDGGTITVPNLSGGTFDLGFATEAAPNIVHWVLDIPYNVTAADLDSRIEAVLGAGTVTCAGGPLHEAFITITFTGAYAATNMRPTLIRTALSGTFSGSYSNEVVRTAKTPTSTANCYDFEIVPGRGTLGLNRKQNWGTTAGDCNWGWFKIVTRDGEISQARFRWADCTATDIENAINEVMGCQAVVVYQIVHDQRVEAVSAYGGTGSVKQWYNRDVFRIVWVNEYAEEGAISEFTYELPTIDTTPSRAVEPRDFLLSTNTPGLNDDDYTSQSYRVYQLFAQAHANGTPIHRWRITPSSVTDQTIQWRYKFVRDWYQNLDTEVGGDVGSGDFTVQPEVNRSVHAEFDPDMKMRFKWVLINKKDISEGNRNADTRVVLGSTDWIDWDATTDQIETLLTTAFPFLSENIEVTGSLYNSWLSEDAIEAEEDDSYNDLRIKLVNRLRQQPLDMFEYQLEMELLAADSGAGANNTYQTNLPQVWQHYCCRPLPPLRSERQSLTLKTNGITSDIYIGYSDHFVRVEKNSTAAEVEALLNGVLGTLPNTGSSAPSHRWLPSKMAKAVTVYGTDVASGLDVEFNGMGYQFSNVGSVKLALLSGELMTLTTVTEGVAPRSETVVISVTNSTWGGTFQLIYNGQPPQTIQWNASAANIDAALQAMGMPAGNAIVSGGPLPTSPVTVVFLTSLGNLPDTLIQIGATSLRNGTVTITETTRGGIDSDKGLVIVETVRGAGPRYYDCPENYDTNSVPSSGDTVIVDDSTSSLCFGLQQAQDFLVVSLGVNTRFLWRNRRRVFLDGQKVWVYSSGTLPNGLVEGYYYIVNSATDATFKLAETEGGTPVEITDAGTGTHTMEIREVVFKHYSRSGTVQIGLPRRRTNGELEYLPTFLEMGFASIELGIEEGDALSLGRFNTRNSSTTITVHRTSTSTVNGVPAVQFLCNNGSASPNGVVYNQAEGDCGMAVYPDESSTVRNITITGGTFAYGDLTVTGNLDAPRDALHGLIGSVGGNLRLQQQG